MPKLYIKEYRKSLFQKKVYIASREGILRDNFEAIIADIKFLTRQGVSTVFFHNIANRFANQKLFSELAFKLPQTKIIRIPIDQDFYQFVLGHRKKMDKIIFLERKYLIDHNKNRINTLTTQNARHHIKAYGDLIANINFKNIIEQICQKIDKGHIERVHILPAGNKTIKHELFTIEGSGTLISNNFTEHFSSVETDEDILIISDILKIYRSLGFLKPRSKTYIRNNKKNFFTAKIDGIIVGTAEKIELTQKTVELGALAISTKFRNQRIGLFLIDSFLSKMKSQGYKRVVSLTNNPKLIKLYQSLDFVESCPPELNERQKKSPTKKIFNKII